MKKQNIIGLIICVVVTGFIFCLWWFNLVVSWENKFYDYKFLIRGKREASKNIVIVGIDDESTKMLGRWPWPRGILAKGIDNLNEKGAKIIGVDIIFPEESQDKIQDIKFTDSLAKCGRVIGALYFEQVSVPVAKTVHGELVFEEELQTKLIYPTERIMKAFKDMGFTNAYPDDDGILREAQVKRSDTGGSSLHLI